jgi:hypothetical protein
VEKPQQLSNEEILRNHKEHFRYRRPQGANPEHDRVFDYIQIR